MYDCMRMRKLVREGTGSDVVGVVEGQQIRDDEEVEAEVEFPVVSDA